ncbi:MAG: FAD-dependent thymidylate synthase [Syntrophales bacterium]|jgi:flavin-dependent thymidylate synthase
MKIILAGYNVDNETIQELGVSSPNPENLTPETIAAAYARISRSPKPVDALRAASRQEVDKARRSNRTIVFEMGHSSIAEHAVFNIDILGVSRLLVEEIEHFRLASYTEKSQRYVLLTDDFVIPEEIRETNLEGSFIEIIRLQNHLYHNLYEKLLPHVMQANHELAEIPANRSMLEGWAKEDARYVLALATETQLGMTINARNLELMIRRLASHPLAEARRFSRCLYETIKEAAPSLIRYTEATEYDQLTPNELQTEAQALIARYPKIMDMDVDTESQFLPSGWCIRRSSTKDMDSDADSCVKLISATPRADEFVVACLIHTSSSLPIHRCHTMAAHMNDSEKASLIRTALGHMKSHDTAPREFEHVELCFEIMLSASAFAQMKRHRMATLSGQGYDPSLGFTIPPSVTAVGMDKTFRDLVTKTEETSEQIRKAIPIAAPYILINAHRRRVLMKVNARELYHIARLRCDRRAQWDIRKIADEMLGLGRRIMPLTLMLATGKDGFADLQARIMK